MQSTVLAETAAFIARQREELLKQREELFNQQQALQNQLDGRGPLDACLPQLGILQCPWHGYRFDLRTGLSADGRSYRLAPPVRVNLDKTTGKAMLIPR
jgi:hypothetical protein